MNIGIIGAGAMGSGIAQVAAQNGQQVKLFDTRKEALEGSRGKLLKTLDKLTAKGKFTSEQSEGIIANISYVESLDAMADSDLVIEAIVENLDIKKSVFQKLETLVGEDCVLATNTSSLSVTSIAAACERPGRVVGIHFFNPAPVMKLVEIIPAIQTEAQVAEKARQIISDWGKTPVVAKDTPAFIVNRVARPFYSESIKMLEEGFADAATIDWAMTALGNFRMGPFTLMDFIGHDVNYPVTETVFKAFYYDPRYRPSFTQKRLVEAGYLGRKSGRGFYDYSDGATRPAPNQDKALGEKILNRVLVMLINEATEALYLNVASRDDIDLAMTKGVNYPKGLLEWADGIGIDYCVSMLDELFGEYHDPRYRCCPLLRKMSRKGELFWGE